MATTPGKTVATVSKTRETLTQKLGRLSETLDAVQNDRERLEEALSNAVRMLRAEDAGWSLPGEGLRYNGLTLKHLKIWGEQIHASLTGTETAAPNPHMRNGLMLRHSFIWTGGIHYDGIPGAVDNSANPDNVSGIKPTTAKKGVKNIQKIIDNPMNQRNFFGDTARQKRERALYADGLYVVVGNSTDNSLRPVPLHEITDTQRDEFYEDEIIAYRWTRLVAQREPGTPKRGGVVVPGALTGVREAESIWVYVDWYEGQKADEIIYGGKTELVDHNLTAFDLHANRALGAPFGSPDAIAALVWARIIRDLIMNGVKMQDALAMFAFKATSGTKQGQQTAAIELAKPVAAGAAATLGGDNDLVPLNSAGRGYDFGSIGFVVATMAASLHVSGIALSANTALAGSSYGAAKTLDLPGQMAMEARRKEHVEFDKRVLNWLGGKGGITGLEVYFDTYDDSSDIYRAVQATMLAWTTGTLTPEGFREELEIIFGRAISGPIPQGAINPNTETKASQAAAIAAAKTTKPDAGPYIANAPPGSGPTTAAPDQGKNSGAGQANHAGDLPPAKSSKAPVK